MTKQPKIVELNIEDGILDGVDAIAFVENPAIEIDFLAFEKQSFETYNDYPKKAIENAKRGIELNKENGNKCATQVGKVRAQQLANGENLSLDTIRRMRSFLIRQRDNYDLAVERKDYNACGYISFLLWGGKEALPWAEKKLRQAGEELSVENEIDMNLDDACQPGYKAIGLKTKNGRKVPNCVPETNLSAVEEKILEGVLFEKYIEQAIDVASLPDYVSEVSASAVGEVDGLPYYKTIEEARAQSPRYGCSLDSWHEYRVGDETYYMPCGSHSDMFEGEYITDLEDNIKDAVLDALLNVGIDEEDLSNEGYDFEKAVRLDADFNFDTFVASVSQIRGASKENQPSVDDYGQWKVLYRYTRYDGTESVGNNSRTFCQNVIKANKWFRKEDINKLTIAGANEGFGLNGQRFYDIFTYKGGKNCQHYWQSFIVPREEKASERKRPSAILDRIVDATTINPDTLTYLLADGRLSFSQEDMDEQQIVATPIMVPNKLITRRDENGDKYYVYFTEETIKKIAYAFAKSKSVDSINLEHDNDSKVDGVYVAESWVVDEPKNDKSNMFGYNLPKGTWFGLFKIDNEDFWRDYIKSGKVKGVSVEGYFVNKLTSLV